jgi:beta-phosphoglucomutase
MAHTELDYPLDPWRIRETSFRPSMTARNETIFALANGHLGLRGNFEEGFCNAVNGTYINGFFEEVPIVYGETAYGYAKNRQVMLNVADGKRITLFVGQDPLDLSSGTILAQERSLDLRGGILTRILRWRSPAGAEIELESRRLVSFPRPFVAAIDYSVRLVHGEAPLRVESSIDGAVTNQSSDKDPRIGSHLHPGSLSVTHREAGGLSGAVTQQTRNTRFTLACVMVHAPGPRGFPPGTETSARTSERGVEVIFGVPAGRGASLRITKYLAYCTSRDEAGVMERARDAASRARDTGFEALMEEQREYLSRFWAEADVEIDGDDALQQSIRYSLFSLLQSAGRDGRTSIAAKGLTGEGYEGHYFWDAEIYVLPFFTYTHPQIARELLRFRIGILDKARARATVMSQRGVLFPWRTIDGQECSAYYPAGTAQYHINADIVYALRKYVDAANDTGLLLEGGAQLVFETARLWADLGCYIPGPEGEFCINEVTGPDEYTALVNNNLFTNLMAKENLLYAAETADLLKGTAPEAWRRITHELLLEESEIERWRAAAARMRIPWDAEKGIHAQDDQFLSRARWDFSRTPAESYPLLLHYHPLVIYRHQVLKQPDVVLAQVLLPHRFSLAEKKRNFDYYDPLTTGDSSLAPCIQSVAAAELGYGDKAFTYFMHTARMDLDDVNGNVSTGVHTAAMAGTWISLVNGFAGMRDVGGQLSFNPRLPRQWRRLRFRLRVRGTRLEVALTRGKASYTLQEGDALAIVHRGKRIGLSKGATVEASLDRELRLVIFDLDGVITDTAEYHFRAWKRLADEQGLPFDRALNEKLKGVSRLESLEIVLRNAGQSLPAEKKQSLTRMKNEYYRELIAAVTPNDLLPGIGELLRRLKAEGIRTAIASVSHNVWEVVRRLEIQPLVDHVVDPALVVKGKPDPEIFYRAAEALGVPFEDCVGIEDAQAGIEAIKAAGMFAVGVGSALQGADWRVAETRELSYETLRKRFEAPR